VPRGRSRAEIWAQEIIIVCGKVFVESDQFVVMQTMGQRAKGRPALGRMPQFLRFLRSETEQRPWEWCNSGGSAPAKPGLKARLRRSRIEFWDRKVCIKRTADTYSA
jgi:hypothetical protein